MFRSLLPLFLLPLAYAGDRITQFATIDALMAGDYHGHFSHEAVVATGHHGIGTFTHIDGEMIAFDGVVYQARADGSVLEADRHLRIPFATMIDFAAEESAELSDITGLPGLTDELLQRFGPLDRPVALRLDGVCATLKTRAPRAQSEPYPPLPEVLKTQAVFEGQDVRGTMIGFYFPAGYQGINAPGIHLHFVSHDHKQGGHVLEFQLKTGTLSLDRVDELLLRLPDAGE
ncbi:MAG: acetolactate decarboxylase [Verrucomicrobiota bacterium JB022]|nr:acetolactate decarboxylase [Verrucomicrobiota bacterium JB022]